MGQGHEGGLRRLLHRLASSESELEAEELQEETREEGGTLVSVCADRQRTAVVGTLRAVTLRPRGGVPALEAELYDGSATLDLVWLGRRHIPGIEPGRRLRAEGLVQVHDERRVMFNPRYDLKPVSG